MKGVDSMSLILHPDYALYEKKDKAFCSSLQIAQEFSKRHDSVLRDIRVLDCSENFRLTNFVESSYRNEQNKKQPMFLMTRDGFVFLTMGYRGKKAATIKEAYIKRFNDMEQFIRDYILARDDSPIFTQAILEAHDEPKSYHYSNEYDMINRIVLGCTAKQFKQAHGLGNVPSIKPFLSHEQQKAIKKLQAVDTGLLYKGVDFQERKSVLSDLFIQKFLELSERRLLHA